MIIADDFMKHGKSGHYYLKHQQDEKGNGELGYVPTLEEDVNIDGLVIAFDSKIIEKDRFSSRKLHVLKCYR